MRQRLHVCAQQVLQRKISQVPSPSRSFRLRRMTKCACGGKKRGKREGGERERQRSKKTPLENGLGKVCGEPVARQWVCCSGSKCLFLSSEFPGSRLAAIPGTGVTFPPEPNEQRERGVLWGGVVRAQTCVHNCTCTWACHAFERPRICMLNVEMCSHSHC